MTVQNFDFDAFKVNSIGFLAKMGNAFAMAAIKKAIEGIRTEGRPANVPLKGILNEVVSIELQIASILTDDEKANEKQLREHFEEYGEEYLREFAENIVAIMKIKGKTNKFLDGLAELLEDTIEEV